jgi:glc operon protein GlcG
MNFVTPTIIHYDKNERSSKMGMTLQAAKEIVEAMVIFATKTKPGRPMTFAVVDGAGVLICLIRMDGASPLSVRMANNKAYTCIDWKRDTKEIRETLFIGEDKRDMAWFGDPRYAPIPGGVLLRTKDGAVAGAVGCSGRKAEEDEELARIGEKAWKGLDS